MIDLTSLFWMLMLLVALSVLFGVVVWLSVLAIISAATTFIFRMWTRLRE